jgi:hypothetical protein
LIVGPRGQTRIEYDPTTGQPWRIHLDENTPRARTKTLLYQPDGQLRSESEPGLPTLTQTVDNLGRVLTRSVTADFGQGPRTLTTTVTYDATGRAERIDSPLADEGRTYDLRGALVRRILEAPLSPHQNVRRAWCFKRDDRGEVAATLGPNGVYTGTFRDGHGLPTLVERGTSSMLQGARQPGIHGRVDRGLRCRSGAPARHGRR